MGTLYNKGEEMTESEKYSELAFGLKNLLLYITDFFFFFRLFPFHLHHWFLGWGSFLVWGRRRTVKSQSSHSKFEIGFNLVLCVWRTPIFLLATNNMAQKVSYGWGIFLGCIIEFYKGTVWEHYFWPFWSFSFRLVKIVLTIPNRINRWNECLVKHLEWK